MKTPSQPSVRSSNDSTPAPGQVVRSRSDRTIGRVIAVSPAAFLIADENQEPSWISMRAIHAIRGSVVNLVCEIARLPRYRTSSPTAAS